MNEMLETLLDCLADAGFTQLSRKFPKTFTELCGVPVSSPHGYRTFWTRADSEPGTCRLVIVKTDGYLQTVMTINTEDYSYSVSPAWGGAFNETFHAEMTAGGWERRLRME